MRFRIEYLLETTRESSVCYTRSLRTSDLELAQLQAIAWSARVCEKYGAGGYQIRDLSERGRVVMLEDFDGPRPSIH